MCRKYCCSITPEECYGPSTFNPNPWLTVFSGSCGKFIILCFLISSLLFVAMVIYASTYASSVLNHPNIVCVPYFSFFCWGILLPICLILWFLAIFLPLWRSSANKRDVIMVLSMVVVFLYGGAFILFSTLAPISDEDGLIIRDGNNSDIMFRYIYVGENIKAYPILLQSDGINDIYPNSTCDRKSLPDLCPIFGPLRGINTSEAFKCTPNAEEGIGLLLLYLGPFIGLARTAMNLGIAFPVFFLFGFTLLMRRRSFNFDELIENRLCLPSKRGPNTRTQSMYQAL
jgi:hypothetical protein